MNCFSSIWLFLGLDISSICPHPWTVKREAVVAFLVRGHRVHYYVRAEQNARNSSLKINNDISFPFLHIIFPWSHLTQLLAHIPVRRWQYVVVYCKMPKISPPLPGQVSGGNQAPWLSKLIAWLVYCRLLPVAKTLHGYQCKVSRGREFFAVRTMQ